MAPLFSIIVPVYNADEYLGNCIESILRQSFENFELILIDDGSKDSSPSICDEFKNKDERVKVIHQINSGVSIARKVGIEAAKGTYIVSVDADDDVESEYLLEASKLITTNNQPDVICFNHYVNDDLYINKYFDDIYLDEKKIKEMIYPYLIHNKRYKYFLPAFWSKIIKRDILIKFLADKRISVSDDVAVIVPALASVKSMYLSSLSFYHYRINKNSITYSKKPRDCSDFIEMYKLFEKNMNLDQYDFRMQSKRLVAHLAFNVCVSQFYGQSKAVAKSKINEVIEIPLIKEAIEQIDAGAIKPKMMRFALRHHSYFLMKIYSKFMMKA